MRLRRAIALLASLLALADAGQASAAWSHASAGSASGKALQMPAGSQPTATVSNRSVTVSWTASTLRGQGVSGYLVKRYDAAGNLQTIGSGCSGTVSGLSCTEAAVPAGTWRYSVTPKQAGWVGSESQPSSAVTVQAPSLTISSPTTLTSLPQTLSGSIAGFVGGQTVSFRLDDPSTGTPLSGSISPSPVPASGGASASVTIPAGTANGAHTVYAIGSAGDVASAQITVSRPQVTSSVIARAGGYDGGYVKQGGTYYVYASVSGSGSPPAGLASLTADVSALTTGQSAAALSYGSYSVGGQTYNYRSAQLTANATLSEGSKSYTLKLTDTAGSQTQSGYTVTVDNTQPRASDVQTANASGGTNGKAEAGDSITLTYSEPIDPASILAGWDGGPVSVVVRLVNGGLASDSVTVWNSANTAQLPLGTVVLNRTDYISSISTITFGASGTPSTMTRGGSAITITLGTPSATASTAGGTGTMSWTPSSTATDRAGNAALTTSAIESGAADKDF